MSGFVKIYRKITEWEWYSEPNTFRVFMHLLLIAKFKDEKWRGIDIKRGQVLTGRVKLGQSCKLTERQIRTAISNLKTTNEITIKTTNEFSIITLTNYELYQGITEENDQPKDQQKASRRSNERPTSDQRATTVIRNNKEREEGEEINYSDFFIQAAERISESVKKQKNITITKTQITNWSKDIHQLAEKELKERQDFQQDIANAINALLKFSGEKYFPVIESGASFREKFFKIENFLKRKAGESQEVKQSESRGLRYTNLEELNKKMQI